MIDYIPILTTILSLYFFIEIFKHYLSRKKKYLLWWMIGVATFGLGTLSESLHTIIGYNEFNLRFWYILMLSQKILLQKEPQHILLL